ncbi:hypothetical protein [Spirosoma agri]|uniref:Uncharacterized protein n=1 Tax=Spirosoma agri TaxID=1987381 RepID=A0A6M0IJY1_9BACT|nr:hypothetical protein [Spirosoma agri]NEU67925.1 hypothetical protein [Spirosoma agri]
MSGKSTKAAKRELAKHALLPKGDANHNRRILRLARNKGITIENAISMYANGLGYKSTVNPK